MSALITTTYHAASLYFRWRRVEVVIQGPMGLPDRPVIYAMNHTHAHDFLPLRWMMLRHGEQLVTWIKPRAYAGLTGAFLRRTGNVLLFSRGALIAEHLRELHGRRPTDDEYRALRDQIDATPDHPIHAAFAERMEETLGLARIAIAEGRHMHIYPQGTVSPQLGPGRSGVIQAALALDLPIVPVGASGIPEAFDGPRGPRRRITLRFGRPYRVPRCAFDPKFRPFHAADEAAHRRVIDNQVDALMERIETLVDPAHRRPAQPVASTGRVGVARFMD